MLQLNPNEKKKIQKNYFACHFFFLTKVNKDEIFSAVRMARSDIYIYIFLHREQNCTPIFTLFFF